MSATIRVGHGRELAAWFAAQPALRRLELVTETEARQRRYRDRLLPLRLGRGSHAAPTPAEAQTIVLLECFYGAASHLLQAEHVRLRERRLSPQQRTAVEHHTAAFAEEMPYLIAVMNEGYWAPLKQRWLARLEPPPRPQRSEDPWERIEARLAHQAATSPYARLDATHDLAHARAVVEAIPDRTAPVDPLALEEEPLFPA